MLFLESCGVSVHVLLPNMLQLTFAQNITFYKLRTKECYNRSQNNMCVSKPETNDSTNFVLENKLNKVFLKKKTVIFLIENNY